MSLRNYVTVTAAYWAFTLTDGALRMLVLLHFNQLGYAPVRLAFLFLLYEFFGIVTNLVGGWVASRTGVRATLVSGLALQAGALGLLALLNPAWGVAASVAWVMGCQALSGIAEIDGQRLDGYEQRDDANYLKHTLAYFSDDGAPRIAYGDVKITKSKPGTRAYGAAGEKADADRKAAAHD